MRQHTHHIVHIFKFYSETYITNRDRNLRTQNEYSICTISKNLNVHGRLKKCRLYPPEADGILPLIFSEVRFTVRNSAIFLSTWEAHCKVVEFMH